MTVHQIKHRYSGAVLFECEVPDDLASGLRTRHALEQAAKARADLAGADLARADLARADLAGADLAGADLAGAYLAGADLAGADLAGANLAGAYLAGANLAGAYLAGANLAIKPATAVESIEALDKVRAIVLDDRERLQMAHWHGDTEWRERTCAEETICGTTHCMAGWLQVCATNPEIRKLDSAQLAGTLAAPIAAKMFFKGNTEALAWLESRQYVQDIADHEKRIAELKAAKAVQS